MARPYRHVPTEMLETRRDLVFARIQFLVDHHFSTIIRPFRKELKLISSELDTRQKSQVAYDSYDHELAFLGGN